MVVLIKGIKFSIKLLSKKDYIKKHSDKEYAHLDRYTKQLVFRQDFITKRIVIHEVTHAFIATLGLGSCNELSVEDFEEIICEMLEDHLMDINKVSNEILGYLKESK